jgi:hypothetical protein
VRGDRAIDIVFLGSLGSPVNPGITTGRSVVFVATYTGAARRATTFQPLLGCIPTSGGGGRGTTAVGAVPARPPARIVRSVRVRSGRQASLAVSCRSGERLVSSSHAVTYRSQRLPTDRALTAVSVARSERGARVEVRAQRGAGIPTRMRIDVQVHAICARGPA